jgi:hypothetical protein
MNLDNVVRIFDIYKHIYISYMPCEYTGNRIFTAKTARPPVPGCDSFKLVSELGLRTQGLRAKVKP